MVFLFKTTVNEKLNKKAMALSEWMYRYRKTLFTDESWAHLQECVRNYVEELNRDYPRTRPFMVRGGCSGLYISVGGNGDIVASLECCHVDDVVGTTADFAEEIKNMSIHGE